MCNAYNKCRPYIRGAWWASTWLLVTLAIVVFDLTSTSIILTDIPMEVNIHTIFLSN